jgi:carboxymethylenebutenolidase
MCYDDTARPPVPPGTHGTAHGEALVLTAADGNRFAAYAAHPAHPAWAQVMVLPDVGGLRPFFKELALRFAEAGLEAVAFDYFGHSAGLTARDDSFNWRVHVPQLHLDLFATDFAAALAHLRALNGGTRATFTIGFCMGGSFSFWCGAADLGLTGVMAFYAHVGSGHFGDESTKHIRIPLLGLFGEKDQFIPVRNVRAFDQQMDEVGIEHQIVVYPGASHGFFEAQKTENADDAWKRVLDFITAHTPVR